MSATSSVGGATTTSSGQVLGATTAAVGGIAILPATGGNPLAQLLTYTAIIVGSLVLLSFILTRLAKRFIA